MSKTKDKILKEALQQLNEKGLDGVSIRTIANALDMSAGNLAYHYKNIDIIIYEIYLLLVKDLSQNLEKFMAVKPDVSWMMNQNLVTFEIMWRYKFILLDFVAITRRIDSIKAHFQDLLVLRNTQMKYLFERWIAEGIFMEERVEGMYEKFALSAIILYNAWIPDAEVHFNKSKNEIVSFYADLFLNLMVPFLTEKGLAEYKQAILGFPKLPVAHYPYRKS